MTYRELTQAQADQFLRFGYVTIERALDPDFCEAEVQKAWVRLGIDEHDPATWTFQRTNMPVMDRFNFADVAPRAYHAICDLLGEDRVSQPCSFGNNLILVLRNDSVTWQPPGPNSGGWHKDGDWFVHFLDSPEQALLVIVLWRDILPKGGGTYFACDSVGEIARYYKDKPEGGYPTGADFHRMLTRCTDYREAVGKAGDIIFMHPYMLHAASVNTLPQPRVISNACVSLREPMNFNPTHSSDLSLLEQSVLGQLGVDRLDFQITGQRGRIIPQREVEWKKRVEEEKARLAAAAVK